jgi:hypothetical protein
MGKNHARKRPNALELQAELAQFTQEVSQFFNEDSANALARETGFVERESKLTGHLFLSIFTFGMSIYGTPSLTELIGLLNQVAPEIELSRQGLHDRINEEAVAFFEKMLALSVAMELPQRLSEAMRAAVCSHFKSILIFDSTSFQLPKELAAYFRGNGGDGPTAAVKIFFGYDFKSCRFTYRLTDGTVPDQRVPHGLLEEIQAGDLEITDLGFFNIQTFINIDSKGAFYLSRLLPSVTLYQRDPVDQSLHEFDLVAFAQKLCGERAEIEICMQKKKQTTTARLIVEKVPDEVKAQRLRKINKHNKRRGYTTTKRTQILSGFNLFITNTPASAIPAELVHDFYRVRWQVELTFKNWKSNFALSKVTGKRPERIKCLLYAKLLFIAMTTKLGMAIRNYVWLTAHREVSLDQAAKHFKIKAQGWLSAIIQEPEKATKILQEAASFIMKRCLKCKSHKRIYPLLVLENMNS